VSSYKKQDQAERAAEMEPTLTLKGKSITKQVYPQQGSTLLELALKHDVDWQNLCTRGTCARCRCYLEAGAEFLDEPTVAEERRLDPEELEEGYRLACQATVKTQGVIIAINKTYF